MTINDTSNDIDGHWDWISYGDMDNGYVVLYLCMLNEVGEGEGGGRIFKRYAFIILSR